MHPNFMISTPELKLALITPPEATNLQTLICNSPSLHQWLDWCHPQFNLDEATQFIHATRQNWIKSDAFGFGVYEQATQQLIGMVAINELYNSFNMASIGYWIGDQYQRQGYAHNAIFMLLDFCFSQLKLTRIEVVCDIENLPSQQLISHLGATQEAIARQRFIFAGKPKDGVVFSFIPEDIGLKTAAMI